MALDDGLRARVQELHARANTILDECELLMLDIPVWEDDYRRSMERAIKKLDDCLINLSDFNQ